MSHQGEENVVVSIMSLCNTVIFYTLHTLHFTLLTASTLYT